MTTATTGVGLAGKPYTVRGLRQIQHMLGGGLTHAEIARQVGRTVCSIEYAVNRYGMARRRVLTGADLARMRGLHARGLSSRDVAREMDLDHSTVCRRLRRMGLAPHGHTAMTKDKLRRATARTLREQGVTGPHELRALGWAVTCVRRGWPGATHPTEADILDALEGGPKAAGELEAEGRTLATLRVRLPRLRRAGLVASERRGGGLVWSLADGVARDRRAANQEGDR
jgi:DNA-binding transcriptional ArsR family regulator